MSTWGKSDKYISEWIHCIKNKRIQAPGHPTFLMLHHPPTLEFSTRPTKTFPTKNCTLLDSLPLELIYDIGMWHAVLLYCNKLKPVLVRLTLHYPVLCATTSYKLKNAPLEYYTNYDHIQYAWADRHLGPHKYEQKWGK